VRTGAFAEHALSEVLDRENLSPEDRSLATEVTYGVLRWRDRLDAIVGRCTNRPGATIRPQVEEILRIALYQLFFLERIPDHAAVDEAVKQTRPRFGGPVAAFVNAVLRNAVRNRTAVDPRPESDPASLARYYSHPLWLVERWLQEYGSEVTEHILSRNNSRSPLVVRANRLKVNPGDLVDSLSRGGFAFRPVNPKPDAMEVRGIRGPVQFLPGYREGLFAVQGSASQLIAPLLGALPGERILDACAAPGGKTAHLAALTENHCRIVAIDADVTRLEETRTNLQRLGVTSAELLHGDASLRDFVTALGSFDRILVDAPCSNLGVLRHNPEVKYRINPEDPTVSARLQMELLRSTAAALGSGGSLLYAVCTVTREETTEVIDSFLADSPGFAVDPFRPDEVFSPELVESRGFLKTFPSPAEEPLDGFFAARIMRR
jgi:16S rRNA (cytosine967-C5)-methyltransferase